LFLYLPDTFLFDRIYQAGKRGGAFHFTQAVDIDAGLANFSGSNRVDGLPGAGIERGAGAPASLKQEAEDKGQKEIDKRKGASENEIAGRNDTFGHRRIQIDAVKFDCSGHITGLFLERFQ
jgi:hypothetical protein